MGEPEMILVHDNGEDVLVPLIRVDLSVPLEDPPIATGLHMFGEARPNDDGTIEPMVIFSFYADREYEVALRLPEDAWGNFMQHLTEAVTEALAAAREGR